MDPNRNGTVVVIDDDPKALGIAREVLEWAGYRVVGRDSAAGAVAELGWCNPDVIVLDDTSVGENRRVVVPLLRKTSLRSNAIVLLHSHASEIELARRVSESGADGYVDKSSGASGLLQEVKRWLGSQRRSRAPARLPDNAERSLSVSQARRAVAASSAPTSLPPAPSFSGTFPAIVPSADRDRRPRLLLVDDELPILSSFRRHLQTAGFHCDFALSGDEALRRLMSDEPPDLVVSDVLMRDPNGGEVFRRMREMDRNWDARYVFVTGDPVSVKPMIRAISGAVPILSKPVSPERLMTTIRRQLPQAS